MTNEFAGKRNESIWLALVALCLVRWRDREDISRLLWDQLIRSILYRRY